jgi:hypothetical protein
MTKLPFSDLQNPEPVVVGENAVQWYDFSIHSVNLQVCLFNGWGYGGLRGLHFESMLPSVKTVCNLI